MDEILAKPPEALSKSEWKWLGEVWAFLTRGSGRGRKKKATYDEWLAKEARAKLFGTKRPRLRDQAGKNRGEFQAKGTFKDEMDMLRDKYKKAKKRRQLPVPPMR